MKCSVDKKKQDEGFKRGMPVSAKCSTCTSLLFMSDNYEAKRGLYKVEAFLVFFPRSHMGSIRCCTSCWLGFWFQVESDRGCNYRVLIRGNKGRGNKSDTISVVVF